MCSQTGCVSHSNPTHVVYTITHVYTHEDCVYICVYIHCNTVLVCIHMCIQHVYDLSRVAVCATRRAESGVRRHGSTRRSKEAPSKPGRDVARRDPSAWGRTFRTAIDDTTRQWSESSAEPRCPIPESDVWRLGWRRTWGRRKCTAIHAASVQRVQHGAASTRLHADWGDPRIPARTGAIRTQYDEPTIPELGLQDAQSTVVLDAAGAVPADITGQHDQVNAVGSVRPDGYHSVHWAASSEPAAKSAAEPASGVQHSRQEDEAKQRRRKAGLQMEVGR